MLMFVNYTFLLYICVNKSLNIYTGLPAESGTDGVMPFCDVVGAKLFDS